MLSLRKSLCNKREKLIAVRLCLASQAIAEKLQALDCVGNGLKIGSFLATRGEASAERFMAAFRGSLYFPVIQSIADGKMDFFSWCSGEPLLQNSFGIKEPRPIAANGIQPQLLDVVLVPTVAFDGQGNRLGMGAGFYDRCFSFKAGRKGQSPLLIGLAYDFQRQAQINPKSWDIPLDIIITPEQVFMPGMASV